MAKLFTEKSISGEITITTGTNDTLTFDINGTTYNVVVPSNTYNSSHFTNTSELVDAIKANITLQSIPIDVKVGGVYSSSSRYCVLAFEGTDLPTNITGNMSSIFI